jgi:hypothetical protein
MKLVLSFLSMLVLGAALISLSCHSPSPAEPARSSLSPAAFLGFDRNIFPDVPALAMLRKTFAFSGYWLSPPPGESTNTWTGQREALRSLGFGFLLLYRGPLERELKNSAAAAQRGAADAQGAVGAAKREGFPARAIIFVDIEEGGRLSENYHAYLHAWAAQVEQAGYRAGAYSSGIPVQEAGDASINTADDIRAHLGARDFTYFICNDSCPPAPGCVFPSDPPKPSVGGINYAAIWQFVRSPRTEFAAHCPPGYHTDGNCYAPGDAAHSWFLDVSVADSSDPSHGR